MTRYNQIAVLGLFDLKRRATIHTFGKGTAECLWNMLSDYYSGGSRRQHFEHHSYGLGTACRSAHSDDAIGGFEEFGFCGQWQDDISVLLRWPGA